MIFWITRSSGNKFNVTHQCQLHICLHRRHRNYCFAWMRIRTPRTASLFRYSVQQTIEAPAIRIYYYFCGSFLFFIFSQFKSIHDCWKIHRLESFRFAHGENINLNVSRTLFCPLGWFNLIGGELQPRTYNVRPLERWERKSGVTHQKWFIKTFYYDFHFTALYVRISIINYNCCWFIGSLNFVLLLLLLGGMSALRVALNILCFHAFVFRVPVSRVFAPSWLCLMNRVRCEHSLNWFITSLRWPQLRARENNVTVWMNGNPTTWKAMRISARR